MTELDKVQAPANLPAPARANGAPPAVAGPMTLRDPAGLARVTGVMGGAMALLALLWPHLPGGLQPIALTVALFGGLHAGLAGGADWRATAAGGIPALAVVQWLMPGYSAFGLLTLGLLAGWAAAGRARDAVTRVSTVLGTGLGVIAGYVAFFGIAGSGVLSGLVPGALVTLGAGAVGGAAIALGTLPRHLPLERDPVEEEYERARLLPGAETRDYLERCMRLYRQVRRSLTEGPGSEISGPGLETLEEQLSRLMLAVFGLARRWRDIDLFLEHSNPEGTRRRLEEADAKLAATEDRYARKQYQQVAESLRRRLQHLDEMRSGKERVVSSLSYYFTTLEDMQLSLMRLKASDTQSASLAIDELAGRVKALNGEMAATARSFEELDFGEDAPLLE